MKAAAATREHADAPTSHGGLFTLRKELDFDESTIRPFEHCCDR
jgi:hypothetical protein